MFARREDAFSPDSALPENPPSRIRKKFALETLVAQTGVSRWSAMRIRWKFFYVLLGFSLIPLFFLDILNHKHMEKLGLEIGDGIRTGIVEIIGYDLVQTAQNYADLLASAKSAFHFAAVVLAKESEMALAGKPLNGGGAGKLYFAQDFDNLPTSPPDIGQAPGYAVKNSSGPDTPQLVSFGFPVFSLAPGANRDAALRDAGRIAPAVRALKGMFRELDPALLWANVSLENGLYMSYPGHGGFPAGYDPRRRPWYENAKQAFSSGTDEFLWNGPMTDAASGQVVYAISCPIAGPDGAFAGAVGLDIPLSGILNQGRAVSKLAANAQTFLTYKETDPKTGEKGLLILAQNAYQDQASTWSTPIAYQWLESDDPGKFKELLAHMASEDSGVIELPYKGEEAIWAFGSVMKDTRFVIVAPKKTAMAMADQAEAEVMLSTKTMYKASGLAALTIFLAVSAVAFVSAKRFTAPMTVMVEAWKRLAQGDYSARINLRAGDERDVLITSFNETVPKLADHLRLSQSMELAQEVQRNLLPAAPPVFPGLDVAGISVYCDETGGDYFDYFMSEREGEATLTAVIGDVTGHGAASALLMATARALFQCATETSDSPAGRMNRANRLLCRDVADSGRFMTVFWMEICPGRKEIRWVRAGHDPTLLVDPESGEISELLGSGIPMGVSEDYDYQENACVFDKPDMVLAMGTDGIWEARNPSGEMYGKERFYAAIRENAGRGAEEIREAVLTALYAFIADATIEDDVTLVIVKNSRPTAADASF